MSLVAAADYGWIRKSPTFDLALEVGYTVVLVHGLGPEQLRGVLRAEPCGMAVGIDPIVEAAYDGVDVVGVVPVSGDGGSWSLLVSVTDAMAMRPRLLETLSEGRRVVAHSGNGGKPMDFFFWYQDGELRMGFESPCDRDGTTPDELVPLMRALGCDVDGEQDLDVYDEKAAVLALAERLTGVRIAEGFLREAEFRMMRVPGVPDEE